MLTLLQWLRHPSDLRPINTPRLTPPRAPNPAPLRQGDSSDEGGGAGVFWFPEHPAQGFAVDWYLKCVLPLINSLG